MSLPEMSLPEMSLPEMSLIEMSLSGAMIVLAALIIRLAAFDRLPKKTFLALWFIVLVRLLVPAAPSTQWSVFNLPVLVQEWRGEAAQTIIIEQTAAPVAQPIVPIEAAYADITAPGAATAEPIPQAPANTMILAQLLIIIWAAGFAALAVFFGAIFVKYAKRFMVSVPAENAFITEWLAQHKLRRSLSVRISPKISTPLTYGILRPVILLPKNIDWTNHEALAYVLAHELVHIKRFDTLTKLVATTALCLHWFNPLAWVMYFLLNRDLEISCDESVIKHFGQPSKAGYAMTLLGMVERNSHVPALYSNFSKYAIEERITAIMKIKNLSFGKSLFKTLAAFALIGVTATVFGTQGVSARPPVEFTSFNVVRVEDRHGARPILEIDFDVEMSPEEAAQIGADALILYFDADLELATIQMSYFGGTEADRVPEGELHWTMSVGGGEPVTIHREYSEEAGGWVPILPPDIPAEVLETLQQRGMLEPQTLGYIERPFRPPVWTGVILPQGAEFDSWDYYLYPHHRFQVNAQTGELITIGFDPAVETFDTDASSPAVVNRNNREQMRERFELIDQHRADSIGEAELAQLEYELTRRSISLAEEFNLFGEDEIVGATMQNYDYVMDSTGRITAAVTILLQSANGEGILLGFRGTMEEGFSLGGLYFNYDLER